MYRSHRQLPSSLNWQMSQSQSHVQSHGPIWARARAMWWSLDGVDVDSLTPAGSQTHEMCDQMKQKQIAELAAPHAA